MKKCQTCTKSSSIIKYEFIPDVERIDDDMWTECAENCEHSYKLKHRLLDIAIRYVFVRICVTSYFPYDIHQNVGLLIPQLRLLNFRRHK